MDFLYNIMYGVAVGVGLVLGWRLVQALLG
jgi:hypothetical protein